MWRGENAVDPGTLLSCRHGSEAVVRPRQWVSERTEYRTRERAERKVAIIRKTNDKCGRACRKTGILRTG